jgi:hypothetical protein
MLTLSLIPSLSVQAKVKWIYNWISDSVAEDKEDDFVFNFLLNTTKEKIYAWSQLID